MARVPRLCILSHAQLMSVPMTAKDGLIVLHDPGRTVPTAVAQHPFLETVACWDVDRSLTDPHKGQTYAPMTLEQAQTLLDAVVSMRPVVGRLIIACDAGVSRSAAVGQALAELWGDQAQLTWLLTHFPRANPLIRRLILSAGGIHSPGARIEDLVG